MLLPARSLLWGAALWLTAGIVASVHVALMPVWWAAGALLCALAVIDCAFAWWEQEPQVRRELQQTLPLAVSSPATLHVRWQGRGRRSVQVMDHAPSGFECQDLPITYQLEPGATARLRYRLRPLVRGEHAFGPVAIRVLSLGRLWWKQVKAEVPTKVRVYPNFAVYSRHALQASSVASRRTGMLKRRRRGEGLDFEQLREYREGDNPRQIDWRATSRIGKLISREYQDERDQRIILLADCGRRMGAKDGELSHFDHALDTLLLLAYVGLRHGDSVGMMTLGGPQRMIAPQKSTATLSRILNAVYDLQPTFEASDFEIAAQTLLTRERKRALVVILTNMREEDDESLLTAVQLLRRHHLVLVASLREKALDETCNAVGEGALGLAMQNAAIDFRAQRDANFRRLRQAGVLCLDVAPGELALATVNRYLAIKAAGVL